MIKIKNVSAKNFISVGNVAQGLDLDKGLLTLVLGENLDLGGDDAGSRNGVGKSTIVNAISYGLFGQAVTKIRKDNLINKINSKNMIVTVEFDSNGKAYRIERGRKPNILKFYIDGEERVDSNANESQGDSRETQDEIERVLGLSHEMFKHIVALNTYTEPFLNLGAADQRAIIEQLLGITKLSERAERLKDRNKQTKDRMQEENMRIESVKAANKHIEDTIKSVQLKQTAWSKKKEADITAMAEQIADMESVNIEAEIQAHRDLIEYERLQQKLKQLNKNAAAAQELVSSLTKAVARSEANLASVMEHRCHACGQDLHDEVHERQRLRLEAEITESRTKLEDANGSLSRISEDIAKAGTLGSKPQTHYDNLEQALDHRNRMSNLLANLEKRVADHDPYQEQIDELTYTGIQPVDFTKLNELDRMREHEEFLLKLLTSKDSFIRKRIIDQNLTHLNQRMAYYLNATGLPHAVVFQSDLSVEISLLGMELDFDNLSRGERNRLILSLSWAFRDVWESLYQPINLLFVDELIDSGMDASGVDSAIAVLKKMSRERAKSIFLISHRDELAGRVNTVLKVVKENGFTAYNTDVDISDL